MAEMEPEASILAEVPEALVNLASKVEIGHDAGRRLLTDGRMVRAWQEIVKRAENLERENPDKLKDRLEGLNSSFRPETWDNWAKVKPWESAVCSIYLGVCSEYAIQRPAVLKTTLEMEINRWRQGAALCREARESPHRAAVDPDLRRALEQVGAYFDGWADLTEGGKDGPSFIARGGRKERVQGRSGDDVLRARTRAVALHFQNVLGTPLAGTVARIMKVAFDYDVTAKDVQNCIA